MAFQIIRNDITKMNTDAIVNTANELVAVGTGCDSAVYKAAGYDQLLSYRKKKIGQVSEGDVFLTPGFDLPAKYIIHAVSPFYREDSEETENKLRTCYRKSLELAKENGIHSIAFPLISTGSFGYPKEEGMRIAVDEISAFLLQHEMQVFLVVFDEKAKTLGERIFPDLEEYIDRNYVEEKRAEEYGDAFDAERAVFRDSPERRNAAFGARVFRPDAKPVASVSQSFLGKPKKEKRSAGRLLQSRRKRTRAEESLGASAPEETSETSAPDFSESRASTPEETELLSAPRFFEDGESKFVAEAKSCYSDAEALYVSEAEASYATEAESDVSETTESYVDFETDHENKLQERMHHLSDTFSEYLLYLIQNKHMENAEVYKRAIVDKKVFSKIKNNADYHPQKITALCLCVGAKLNLDESKDLLARAGYALSPCDKTDIIFSYFIENGIYDMIELDIQLEEHGLPCIIS